MLSKITHKYIVSFLKKWIFSLKTSNAVVEAPLLFEAKIEKLFDVVVYVLCRKKDLLGRALLRGYKPEEARAILRNQAGWRKNAQKADYRIYNTGTKQDLRRRFEFLMKKIERNQRRF